MYIFKNALRHITRAKGRSFLIFILVTIITLSACVALSIKNSADTAKESAYDELEVSASISYNRESMMSSGRGDSEAMSDIMSTMSETMSIDELSIYAQAESVADFYYNASISLDMYDEDFTSYSIDTGMSQSSGMGQSPEMGMTLGMTSAGDFTINAYSTHSAMSLFIDGTLSISEGSMYDEDESENYIVISEEIAILNDLSVDDTFELVNGSNEDEVIEFTIIGIFECESTDAYANEMYISYTALEAICENSETIATYTEDEFSGIEISSALTLMPTAIYVFDSPDDYEAFTYEAEALGLDTETYTISSTDLLSFEESTVALDNLSEFTMTFFLVILGIGAIILVVFNLFVIRERKYEIGVLAAIGMHKQKVALQFVAEIVMITFVAVIIGTSIGVVISSPIADSLLEDQIASTSASSEMVSDNFGGNFSPEGQSGMSGDMAMESGGEQMGMDISTPFGSFNTVDVIDSISTSTDLIVLVQLMGLGLLLSIISSSVAMISILRYEPLKILSERS